MKFNNEQQAVIDSKADKIVVIAGAGSGKTATMLRRISRQIDDGADPSSFLVLTFTRAAALNMKQRYIKEHKGESAPNFVTFHAFCYQLLCSDHSVLKALGYSKLPTVCDTNQERKLKKMSKMKASIKLTDKKLETSQFLSPLEQYEYQKYQKMLKKLFVTENTISFDKLMEGVVELFVNDDKCIQKYKSRYKYIYVDEFQDTDPKQWQFVKTFIGSANIMVVGDAAQAIYAFRNATSAIIKSLASDDDWTQLQLHENYRSTKEIVEFANQLCKSYIHPDHRVLMTAHQSGKRVSVTPLLYQKYSMDNIQDDEMLVLTSMVNKFKGTTAILARTNREVAAIKQCLESANISYVESNKSSEIVDILHSVADNEYLVDWTSSFLKTDEYANYLRWRTIWYAEHKAYPAISDYVDKYSHDPKIRAYLSVVFGIRLVLSSKDDVFTKIMTTCKYLNLEFNDVVGAEDDFTNGQIIKYIIERAKAENHSDVYVGTVHSVKGLEYDNVLLLGVNDKCWKLNNEDNLNLYYVGITRAKSQLFVFLYEKDLCYGGH